MLSRGTLRRNLEVYLPSAPYRYPRLPQAAKTLWASLRTAQCLRELPKAESGGVIKFFYFMYQKIIKQALRCNWWRSLKNNEARPKILTLRGNFLICVMVLPALCGFVNKAVGQTWLIGDGQTNAVSAVQAILSGNTLTISGTGNMADFYDTQGKTMFGWDLDYRAPWYNLRSSIHTVIICDNVTNIGDGAFEYCSNLTSVTIPTTVRKIGKTSFRYCTSLNNITLPACIYEIEGGAFCDCSNLTVDCRIDGYPTISTNNPSYDNEANQYPFNGIYKLRVLPQFFTNYPSNGYIKEVLYDEVLITPTYENQTKNVTISYTDLLNPDFTICSNYSIFKVSVIEGVIYKFSHDFGVAFDPRLYNNYGELVADLGYSGILPYQSTFTGDVYLLLEGSGSYTPTYRGYLSEPSTVTVAQNGSSVSISWNNVPAATSYTLYRSSDGYIYKYNYTAIKTGISGTSTTDSSPLSGNNFYEVEADNSFTKSDLSSCLAYVYYTATNGINNIATNQLSIYPTPAKNEVFIKSDLQIEKIEIYSLAGSLLLSKNNFDGKISVSALSKGVYLLKIYTDTGLAIRKIVKD